MAKVTVSFEAELVRWTQGINRVSSDLRRLEGSLQGFGRMARGALSILTGQGLKRGLHELEQWAEKSREVATAWAQGKLNAEEFVDQLLAATPLLGSVMRAMQHIASITVAIQNRGDYYTMEQVESAMRAVTRLQELTREMEIAALPEGEQARAKAAQEFERYTKRLVEIAKEAADDAQTQRQYQQAMEAADKLYRKRLADIEAEETERRNKRLRAAAKEVWQKIQEVRREYIRQWKHAVAEMERLRKQEEAAIESWRERVRTPEERLRRDLDTLRRWLETGKITAEEFRRMWSAALDDVQSGLRRAVQTVDLSEAFEVGSAGWRAAIVHAMTMPSRDDAQRMQVTLLQEVVRIGNELVRTTQQQLAESRREVDI